jgi:hypothetical protein
MGLPSPLGPCNPRAEEAGSRAEEAGPVSVSRSNKPDLGIFHGRTDDVSARENCQIEIGVKRGLDEKATDGLWNEPPFWFNRLARKDKIGMPETQTVTGSPCLNGD